ncbi:MAG: biopolymer transporter ExbB, partial [Pseudomonadota bacterium]
MVLTETEAAPQFSQPLRQIILMLLVIIAVSVGAYFLYPDLAPVFLQNPFLNGLIIGVFLVGLIACFWQVVQLVISVNWIHSFVLDAPGHAEDSPPRLLASLAALMRTRGRRTQISASSQRSILETVGTRIDEARDITRYLVSLLIFLGLLGTFYGLATTVPAVVDTIRSLAPQEGEAGTSVFSRLIGGLESQLNGMGTAFASSLLGLAGSLVVGLLELFASHGQNRFYRELEEWLSTITRLSFAGAEGEASGEGGSAGAAMEYMASQMETMQRMFAQADANRAALDDKISALTDKIGTLTERMEGSAGMADALTLIADGQERLNDTLGTRSATGGDPLVPEDDAEARMRLRSIDNHLLRLLEEISAGRQ